MTARDGEDLIVQDSIYVLPALQLVGPRPAPQSNMPVPLTPLIGREQEVETCCALLQRPEVRLVTLIGPGGVGKTRLGLQVGRELLHEFADGACFVSLAPISSPELVISTIAQACGLREVGDLALRETLGAYLREKRLLLLLDNFEQVAAAASELAELLASCPELRMLVTSRAALHIHGEYEFFVPPLAMPDPTHLPNSELLSQYPAIALFLRCTQAIAPQFRLTKENARTIAEICALLDGLPLAIELAAARMKLLPPQALQDRLNRRLAVLTSGAQNAPARQQTLRNTITWSYDLLKKEEQELFRQLSVFVGGCSLEAAEAIHTTLSGKNEASPALDRVASLIDQSLLRQTEQEGHEPRLIMLETIREFGQELLAMSGEMEASRQAHAEYYLKLTEEAEQIMRSRGKGQRLMNLQRDHDNIRAALQWLVEREEIEKALSMGLALWRFWWMYGYLNEGCTFLEWALLASQKAAAPVRAKLLTISGWLFCLQGNVERAAMLCRESLAIFRELEDTRGMMTPLWMLGYMALIMSDYTATQSLTEEALILSRTLDDKETLVYSLEILATATFYQGEYGKACALFEESLGISRKLDNPWGIAHSLCFLALVILSQGDRAGATTLLEESLSLSRKIDYKVCIAHSLNLLGQISLQQGNMARTYALMEESLEIFKELGDQQGIGQVLSALGWASFAQGDYVAAQTLLYQSLEIGQKIDNKWFIAFCLEGLGCMVAFQGDPAYAVRLLSAAGALCEAISAVLPPIIRGMRESTLAAARAQLGERAFAAAWTEGRALTPEQVLDDHGPVVLSQQAPLAAFPRSAPTTSQPVTSAKKPSRSPDRLTTREIEILRLVAQGLTDAQVAEQLIISPRTVNWHLRAIYGKLGVSSRSAATRYALEHNLA